MKKFENFIFFSGIQSEIYRVTIQLNLTFIRFKPHCNDGVGI